jgi:hypothetical protein
MCGIVGTVGTEPAAPLPLGGRRRVLPHWSPGISSATPRRASSLKLPGMER